MAPQVDADADDEVLVVSSVGEQCDVLQDAAFQIVAST